MRHYLVSALILLTSLSSSASQVPAADIHVSEQQGNASEVTTINPSLNQSAQTSSLPQISNHEVWFTRVDVYPGRDADRDGYVPALTIRFDADSIYASMPVYAVYSLIDGNVERVIYTSSIFNVYGNSQTDWFEITADFNALPRSYYSLRIQLFDAMTGYRVAEISGYENYALRDFKLEDYASDQPYDEVVYVEAGSTGILSICLLGFFYLQRRVRRYS